MNDVAINARQVHVPEEGGQHSAGGVKFSFVTLVTKPDQYAEMIESFRQKGFDDSCAEYLYVDNSQHNALDGFSGLTALINEATGTYIICVHQDVIASDGDLATLDAELRKLDALDPTWAVAGNAGRRGERYFMAISDPRGDDQFHGPLPAKVDVLDENFIVLKASAMVAPSIDLSGFHLYGVDLCLQAQGRGYSCYAIEFRLTHLSKGLVDQSYLECREAFESKLEKHWQPRLLQSMAEDIWLGPKTTGFLKQYAKRRKRVPKLLERAAAARQTPRQQTKQM